MQPRRRQGALPVLTKAWEHHHPRGVIGIISPWNYPLTLAVGDAVPALMAGNGVVVKPDALTPFSALWAAGLLEEAGLPHGLLQVVTGRGAELGEPLVDGADYLMFTGSTATGRKVAALAAERLKDSSMELGGKNALLVLPDASLRRAVPGAVRGITSNSGQLCISIERVYVHAAVYDVFAARLAESLRAVRLGPSLTFLDDMGSLIGADQLAKVEGHVADAVGKGAEVLAGGRARPELGPYFFEPTLLAGVERRDGPVPRRDLRPRRGRLPLRLGAGDGRPRQRLELRPQRQHLDARHALRPRAGRRACRPAPSTSTRPTRPRGPRPARRVGSRSRASGGATASQGIVKFTEAQTVAVERLMAIDTPPFLSHQQYATLMSAAMKLLKHAAPLIK